VNVARIRERRCAAAVSQQQLQQVRKSFFCFTPTLRVDEDVDQCTVIQRCAVDPCTGRAARGPGQGRVVSARPNPFFLISWRFFLQEA